jgi:Protein of unknown function (DUF2628)
MTVYSVLEPPARFGEREAATDRFVFVRDGFSWAAFLFGALWMIWRGLWLILTGYIVFMVALEGVLRLLGEPGWMRILIGFLIALLIGFEAASLRRWTLLRRGWRDRGIVVADDLEAAEGRFFSSLAATTAQQAGGAAVPQTSVHRLPASPPAGVIGLFPQPGAGR